MVFSGAGELWDGSLFVFDGRLAVGPDPALPAAAPCVRCGGPAHLPHMNCSNIDCNQLFIACEACKAYPRPLPVSALFLFACVWGEEGVAFSFFVCLSLPAVAPACGAAAPRTCSRDCSNIDCNQLFIACEACKV
jgi:predicted sulfurtransferase